MPALTKRTVDATKPDGSSDRFVWDDEVKGLGLRVRPSGHKSFVFQFRIGGRGGSSHRLTIGDYSVVAPDQARRQAKQLAGAVAQGLSLAPSVAASGSTPSPSPSSPPHAATETPSRNRNARRGAAMPASYSRCERQGRARDSSAWATALICRPA